MPGFVAGLIVSFAQRKLPWEGGSFMRNAVMRYDHYVRRLAWLERINRQE